MEEVCKSHTRFRMPWRYYQDFQTKLTAVTTMPCIPFGPHELGSVGSYLIDTAIWLTNNRLQRAKLLANFHFAAYSV